MVAKIVDHFRRRAPVIELGNLDVARDFSDVRDVAEVYLRLIESHTVSDIVNVCSGRAYALQYVIDTLQTITGHSIDVRVNPAFVRIDDPKLVRGSTERLDRLVGSRDIYPLEDTLRWAVEVEVEAIKIPQWDESTNATA